MIIFSPFPKKMRIEDKPHPKSYPYWEKVIKLLQKNYPDQKLVQVGVEGEQQLLDDFRKGLSLDQLGKLVDSCDTWISVDSFFQHFCWDRKKRGVVLFGQSDPVIFGHPENINLLKHRKFLREKQYWLWEQAEANPKCWVSPEEVVKAIKILV